MEFPHPYNLPLHWDGGSQGSGQIRVCGRIKTEDVGQKRAIPPFSEFLAATQTPLIPFATMGEWDRLQSNIPILDQKQVGSCVGHCKATWMMKARDLEGQEYLPLSPDGLYAYINGGVDQGADPGDAVAALSTTGIPLLSDVPDEFIKLSQISDQAKQNALRFRVSMDGVYQCTGASGSIFAEMCTADYLGFAVSLTVNVGGAFTPNSEGVVNVTRGFANHSVSGGEAMKFLKNGSPAYRFRNSWNTSWGINGFAWVTAAHIDPQPGVEIYVCKWTLSDPQDPNFP